MAFTTVEPTFFAETIPFLETFTILELLDFQDIFAFLLSFLILSVFFEPVSNEILVEDNFGVCCLAETLVLLNKQKLLSIIIVTKININLLFISFTSLNNRPTFGKSIIIYLIKK